jgi:hypothetical protein
MGQSKLPRPVFWVLFRRMNNLNPRRCKKGQRAMVNTSATISFARGSLSPNTSAITCTTPRYMVHVFTVAINGTTHTHHCISTANHWLCNDIYHHKEECVSDSRCRYRINNLRVKGLLRIRQEVVSTSKHAAELLTSSINVSKDAFNRYVVHIGTYQSWSWSQAELNRVYTVRLVSLLSHGFLFQMHLCCGGLTEMLIGLV